MKNRPVGKRNRHVEAAAIALCAFVLLAGGWNVCRAQTLRDLLDPGGSDPVSDEVYRQQYAGTASDGNEYVFRIHQDTAGVCHKRSGALSLSDPNASVSLTPKRGGSSFKANVTLRGNGFQGGSECTSSSGKYDAGVQGSIDRCFVRLSLTRTWLPSGPAESLEFSGGSSLAECR
jgi:hypothetical protein